MIKKEKHTATVEKQSILIGIDRSGFPEYLDHNIIRLRTAFKVGEKVKVTVEKV